MNTSLYTIAIVKLFSNIILSDFGVMEGPHFDLKGYSRGYPFEYQIFIHMKLVF